MYAAPRRALGETIKAIPKVLIPLILATPSFAQDVENTADNLPDFDGEVREVDGQRQFIPHPGSELYNWMMDTEVCRENPEFAACEPDARVPLCLREPQFAVCEVEGNVLLPGEGDPGPDDLDEAGAMDGAVDEAEALIDEVERDVTDDRNCARLRELERERRNLMVLSVENYRRLDELIRTPHEDWLPPDELATAEALEEDLRSRVFRAKAQLGAPDLSEEERSRLEVEHAFILHTLLELQDNVLEPHREEDEQLGYGGQLRLARNQVTLLAQRIIEVEEQIARARRTCTILGE